MTWRFLLAGTAIAALGWLILSPTQGRPPPAIPNPTATLHTTAGDVTLLLRRDAAPCAVDAFIRNCRLGVYDNVAFTEAGPSVVYVGAELRNGAPKPTARVANPVARECANGLHHQRGAISLRTYLACGSDIDSHELCICLTNVPQMDGKLTVFAEVLDGLGVVETAGSRVADDPVEVLGTTVQN